VVTLGLVIRLGARWFETQGVSSSRESDGLSNAPETLVLDIHKTGINHTTAHWSPTVDTGDNYFYILSRTLD